MEPKTGSSDWQTELLLNLESTISATCLKLPGNPVIFDPLFRTSIGEKKSLTFAFWQGFSFLFGVNYMAEFTSIKRALAAFGRGANLPYFDKQTNIWPYSPREQKRKAI